MQGLCALSVALVIVLQSVFVAAQDTPTEAQPASQTETLPPVVVSATRGGPRSAEALPVSVTVITREEIEASPGTTVDEILRNVPGIQLQLTNSNTILPIIPSISMRGLGLGDNGIRTLHSSVGVFGEVSVFPHPKFEILGSLRGDFFRDFDGQTIENGAVTNFADRSFNEVTFRLALRYQLVDAVAVRGAAYRGFRAPTLANLYRSFGTTGFVGLANPQLDPETLIGGEVGVDLQAKAWKLVLQINGFYNVVNDFMPGWRSPLIPYSP